MTYCKVKMAKAMQYSCKDNATFNFLGINWERKGPGECIFQAS